MLPEKLVQLAKERMAPYPCEGFLPEEGQSIRFFSLSEKHQGRRRYIAWCHSAEELAKSWIYFWSELLWIDQRYSSRARVRSRPYQYKTKQIRGETVTKKYNRTPTKAEILAHAPVLDYEIAQAEPEILVTLGRIGWERITGSKEKITEVAGKLIEQPVQQLKSLEDDSFILSEKIYRIFPTYHPASVLQSGTAVGN